MTGTNGRGSRHSHRLSLILRPSSRPFPASNEHANVSSLLEEVLDVGLDGNKLKFGTSAAPIPTPEDSAHATMPSSESKRRSNVTNVPPSSPPHPLPHPALPLTPQRYSLQQHYAPPSASRNGNVYKLSVSLYFVYSQSTAHFPAYCDEAAIDPKASLTSA